MFRRTVIKILVVCIAAFVAFVLFGRRDPDLLEPIADDAAATLEERLTGLSVHTYDSATTPLYNDRRYHTKALVPRLQGLRFVPVARNEVRPFVLRVSAPTTVYTIANRLDLRSVETWNALPDPVLVDDAYSPRRLDLLLERHLEAGTYAVRNPENGPSRPVFFDPAVVEVVR